MGQSNFSFVAMSKSNYKPVTKSHWTLPIINHRRGKNGRVCRDISTCFLFPLPLALVFVRSAELNPAFVTAKAPQRVREKAKGGGVLIFFFLIWFILSSFLNGLTNLSAHIKSCWHFSKSERQLQGFVLLWLNSFEVAVGFQTPLSWSPEVSFSICYWVFLYAFPLWMHRVKETSYKLILTLEIDSFYLGQLLTAKEQGI